jgi:hypothetical protein
MKNRGRVIALLCLLVSVSAGAVGSKESKGAPIAPARAPAPVRQREPAPPPSFIVAGGVDVMRGSNRVIGGYVEGTAVIGNLGISVNGDIVALTLPRETDAKALGALGFMSVRYYGRLTPLMGNYFVVYFFGLAAGYGVMGFEDQDSSMSNMSYMGLAPAIPFGGEIGFQAVFASRLLIQSLVRVGGAYPMGNEIHGVFPFGSVSLSAGVFLD